MAGRNRNTFLKRQKEMGRVEKAREKMARRHGRAARERGQGAEEPSPEAETPRADFAEAVNARKPEAQI
jgi:hypothetical protein